MTSQETIANASKQLDLNEQINRLTIIYINQLKEALKKAITTRQRITKKCIEFDPAGSVYDIDFTDDVKKWAQLCDLDLSKLDPSYYD